MTNQTTGQIANQTANQTENQNDHDIDHLKRQCNLLFKRYREKIFQKHNAEAHEIKALDDEIDAILDSYQRCKGEWEKKEQTES